MAELADAMTGNKSIKWSHNLTYAIGLLTTDGSLSNDGRHIEFTSKDIDLINVLKRCLKLNNKITTKSCGYTNNRCSRIQFGNVHLYKFLLNIGLMPNKTKAIGKLDIPDKYFFDFLRGHLDGDGYIRRYQDSAYPNSKRLYVIFLSASLKHLLWLKQRINSLIGIEGRVSQVVRCFKLTYAKKESKILLRAMYYNKYLPCLKRKLKIVESFL